MIHSERDRADQFIIIYMVDILDIVELNNLMRLVELIIIYLLKKRYLNFGKLKIISI